MTRSRLRTVFFGTSEFAVPCLEALVSAGHELLAVVTQPDKPHGRGMQLAPSPVKLAAVRLGLPTLQPRRVRSASFLSRMHAFRPDVLTLAAFGQIIPQDLLDLPPLGPINVHGSLLPKYRGAAPIQRAIMAGDTETGVTTMWMDATLDTGDMLLARSLQIRPEDTAGSLIPKLAALGAELLVETLDGLAAGTIPRRPQNHSEATFAPALTREDGLLRWSEPAFALRNQIRGVSPKPGAFTRINGRRVKVWGAALETSPGESFSPGTVSEILKRPAGVLVAAGEGTALLLTEIQPDSGKRMPADAWARGQRIATGDTFA